MGKYIVELKKNETLYKATTRESDGTAYVCSAIGTPYTAPDLEQVRKEAYDKAYADAVYNCSEGCSHVEQIRQKAYKEGVEDGKGLCPAPEVCNDMAYQKGLSDAWDAAKKIYLPTEYGGIPADVLRKIFNNKTASGIFKKVSASEAVEKIRQYEQEKQFHVGDEFENENGKRFVILKMDDAEIDRYIDEEGKTYCMTIKYRVMRKTGRHFPEIAEVFAKMKETDNG